MIFVTLLDDDVECPTCHYTHQVGDDVFVSCIDGHAVAYCNTECAEGGE